MIRFDDRTTAVRKLLRQLRRPHLLARDPLAVRIRERFKTQSSRDGVVQLIEYAFADHPAGGRLREILVRTDLHGFKAVAVAGAMHLSLRQFFRCRAEAIQALALAIEQLDEAVPAATNATPPVYCAVCYRQISNP